jgi:hypothetical protein
VWSWGATLFHALEGHPPYQVGDNVLGALYRIVNEDPPQTRAAGWLAPVLTATMTREPSQRWPMASVHEFLVGGPRQPARQWPPWAGWRTSASPSRSRRGRTTTTAVVPLACCRPPPPRPHRRSDLGRR